MTKLNWHGIKLGSMQILLPVLKEWLRINEDWEEGDAAWWYNERAVLSVFAGAIWRCDGWAIEEFSTEKRSQQMAATSYKGRCDIAFGINDKEFWCEAKQCWSDISSDVRALNQVRNTIERASQDVRKGIEKKYDGLALVFVSPFLRDNQSDNQNLEASIANFIQCLQQIDEITLAWTFPKNKLNLAPADDVNTFYPGGVLIIKPVV